jgi:TonB family protein
VIDLAANRRRKRRFGGHLVALRTVLCMLCAMAAGVVTTASWSASPQAAKRIATDEAPMSATAAQSSAAKFTMRLASREESERVAVLYVRLAPLHFARKWKLGDKDARALLKNPEVYQTETSFEIEEGADAGHWIFEAPTPGETRMTRASRIVDHGSVKQYDVERIGYCDDDRMRCQSWFDEQPKQAPVPKQPRDSDAYAQWRRSVLREVCRPGSERKGILRFDDFELPEGGLTARAEVLLNPCGEVRDVQLISGSGIAQFDRIVLRDVRRWRLNVPMSNGEGTVAQIPIKAVSPEE